ncbi:shikimate kinase [Helicobacter suis]|uniref:Shikimate kinase n=2 Tax=Helicobacter suis TaxID=104628 RepID=E7G346_9HELI|nr:shikimate kinase [Helicobacter suis]EFX42193.1 shikimate kinase [Helicobacter suis HS5]EFX43311.1 shikimate kinase [Helicobacter suis HS1]BCD45621.1 Shikimate kinase AroK [Helicobacter suis]BCD47320.1 Shikimate kinase AroK [Helicobacter suis]BCD49074.1 Shikimate kinase AroK [Helicobacter suis]
MQAPHSFKIWLIGFMGSGKSTIGALLAQMLGCSFLDTDLQISAQEGLEITQIFNKYSEGYFRKLEKELVSQISQLQTPLVIATGGGLPIFTPIEVGVLIYLCLDFKVLYTRLINDSTPRPLFKTTEQLHALYQKRCSRYDSMAHHRINANQSPERVIADILKRL